MMGRCDRQLLHASLHHSSSPKRRRLLASLAAAGVAGTGSIANADIATTLTGVPGTVTNSQVPVNHGSTAEATLDWPANLMDFEYMWEQYADWDGRGDVYQVNQTTGNISIAPVSPTIKITLESFEFDEWGGGGDTSALWSVTGSVSGVLASGNWTDKNTANDPADAGGRTLITPNATGAPGESLTLAIDHSAGGYVSYLAIDNLTFLSMVVPEPATAVMAWMGVGGLGALAMRRKRK
jgi:hypothetical protein